MMMMMPRLSPRRPPHRRPLPLGTSRQIQKRPLGEISEEYGVRKRVKTDVWNSEEEQEEEEMRKRRRRDAKVWSDNDSNCSSTYCQCTRSTTASPPPPPRRRQTSSLEDIILVASRAQNFFQLHFCFLWCHCSTWCTEFEDFTKWQTNSTCTIFLIPKSCNMCFGVLTYFGVLYLVHCYSIVLKQWDNCPLCGVLTQLTARCCNVNKGFQKLETISIDLIYVDE